MLRTLGISCLLIVVIIAGWIWSSTGDGTTPPAPPVPKAADTQPPSKPLEANTADATMDLPAPERSVVDAPKSPELPIADDAVWIDVIVVDATTEDPVAGVDVWWSNDQQRKQVMAMPTRLSRPYWGDQERIQREFGWHARTDKDGRVRVTPGASGAGVLADDGERFGTGYFSAEQDVPKQGHRLEITIDRTLQVLVLDANDQPASGVPVHLIRHDATSDKPLDRRNPSQHVSDDDGIATIRHAQNMQAWQWGPNAGEPVPNWALVPVAQGFQIEPLIVDAQSPPTDPVELRLPPTGNLRVRVTFEGRAIPSLEQLSMHADPKRSNNAINQAWNQSIDADGWFRFTHVALGKVFFLGNHHWDVEITGPVAAGQETQATIEIADQVFALSGRVLGGDGQPLANATLPVRFDFQATRGGKQVTTDENGRFLWVIMKLGERESLPLKELAFELHASDKTPKVCTVAPRDIKAGRNDLGDLRFALAALVVSGQLVYDREGRHWAGMIVEQFTPSSRRGRPDRWTEVQKLQIAHQANGDFEVRGKVNAGRYRLAFGSNYILTVKPVEFVPGAENVTIHVACGSKLKATCLLAKGINAYQMRAELVPHVTAKPVTPIEEMTFEQRLRRNRASRLVVNLQQGKSGIASCTWETVPDGTYTLRFDTQGSQEPLLQIPDIVIPPPADGDPRLVDIDLQKKVRTLKLTVLQDDADEERRRRVMMFVLPQPDDADWRGIGLNEATTLVPVPAGPVDLMVIVDDLQPITLRGVQDEVEVIAKPWPSVELTFPGLQDLPKDVRIMAGCPTSGRPERDDRRYSFSNGSGQLTSLLQPRRGLTYIENGTATIIVGEGVQTLQVRVRVGRRTEKLKQFAAQQLVAGTPTTVQLSMDEITAVADELRANQKK